MKPKKFLLPKLAFLGIRKNVIIYFPYMAACICSVFAYFTFDSILRNDIMKTLPRAAYARMMLSIGLVLLIIILTAFLFYTNSFLIKRRTKELGLYSILGMEKKHIAVMMFLETLFAYLLTMAGGILCGLVFSKLFFLILLNLIALPPDTAFAFSPESFRYTMLFFGFVFVLNLAVNLIHVGKSNPVELMGAAKKGEKEPKHLWFLAAIGVLLLGVGYFLAVTSKMDSTIFTDFFMAVFCVIAGTYFIFTSGSIAFLRILKKKKRFFYQPSHFITISGMLYRMKKNAAGLVNICIFATMSIITLLCTVALYVGTPGVMDFMYPFDSRVLYLNSYVGDKEIREEKIRKIAEKTGGRVSDYIDYAYTKLSVGLSGNQCIPPEKVYASNQFNMCLMSAECYNTFAKTPCFLQDGEVLLYSEGTDFGYGRIVFGEQEYRVVEELKELPFARKAERNNFSARLFMIVKDETTLQACAAAYGVLAAQESVYQIDINYEGEEAGRRAFLQEIYTSCAQGPGFMEFADHVSRREEMFAMCGSLLFIGIFLGITFMMCLLLAMYYKQITEGFEDKDSFEIMQKVGMSNQEVKETIHRQIKLVFFLPLAGAVLHTAAGMPMILNLFAALNLFQTKLVIICGFGAILAVSFLYAAAYALTARIYYKIVKQPESGVSH